MSADRPATSDEPISVKVMAPYRKWQSLRFRFPNIEGTKVEMESKFQVGDRVIARSGQMAGHSGWVTRCFQHHDEEYIDVVSYEWNATGPAHAYEMTDQIAPGGRVARAIKKSEHPTYRIPAREVVPGRTISLTDGICLGAVTGIRASTFLSSDILVFDMSGTMGNYVAGKTDLVPVQLPGPSPREILCPCSYSSDRRRYWHDEPDTHLAHCPVAPNLDAERGPVHGGLRLWPVNSAWMTVIKHLGPAGASAMILRDIQDPADIDGVLQSYYLPPIIPDRDDKPANVGWDPEAWWWMP